MVRQWMMALAGAVMFASAAHAIDLDSAKAQGLVGEQRNGYLGVVASGNSEAQALANDINAKRKAEYARIASQNGQAVSVIEKLAAAKAFDMTKPGHYLQDAGGNWIKK